MRVGEPSSPRGKNLRHLVNICICMFSVIGVAFLWFWAAPGAAADVGCRTGWAGLNDKYEGLQLWLWFVICFVAGGVLYGMIFYMTWALCKPTDRAPASSTALHTLSPSHPSSRGSSLNKFHQLGGPVPGPPARPASSARSHRSSRGSSPSRSDWLGPRTMFSADYPAAAYSSDFLFFNQSGEQPWEFAPIPFGIIPAEPTIWNQSHDPR